MVYQLFQNKVLIAFLFLFYLLQINSQTKNDFWEVGEDLTYEVSYSLIKLGTIQFKTLQKVTENNKIYFRTIVYIDSYSAVPFVDLHYTLESKIETEDFYSVYFKSLDKREKKSFFIEYTFNEESEDVHIKKGRFPPFRIDADSICDLNHKYQDGLSLFYFARLLIGSDTLVNADAFIEEKIENVSINYSSKKHFIEISNFNEDIVTNKIYGNTKLVGIFGMTGAFEGYFSADQKAIPIRASLNVLLGKINIELIKWKTKDWSPPTK